MGRTILHETAANLTDKHVKVIEVLLEHGASHKIKDDNGLLPLHHLACGRGSVSAIYVLLPRMVGDGSRPHFQKEDVLVEWISRDTHSQ